MLEKYDRLLDVAALATQGLLAGDAFKGEYQPSQIARKAFEIAEALVTEKEEREQAEHHALARKAKKRSS